MSIATSENFRMFQQTHIRITRDPDQTFSNDASPTTNAFAARTSFRTLAHQFNNNNQLVLISDTTYIHDTRDKFTFATSTSTGKQVGTPR